MIASKGRRLPQLDGGMFLTDGGLETTLIFHDGMELPHFASFPLVRDESGRRRLIRYYELYIGIAKSNGMGFILESPTWRASADWCHRLGWSMDEVAAINRESIELMRELAIRYATPRMPMVVSGCVGPRGDGYNPREMMTAEEAETYHALQIGAFAAARADMVAAFTMTNVPEAIGIVAAARRAEMPVAISFTLETDGCLPTGQSLGDAIAEVDAATLNGAAYYMINCAHPTHFTDALPVGVPWVERIRGVRANASKRSHQELDDAPDLDDGNPRELGLQHAELLKRHPHITILGGCCGTDHRHVASICASRPAITRAA